MTPRRSTWPHESSRFVCFFYFFLSQCDRKQLNPDENSAVKRKSASDQAYVIQLKESIAIEK